jgi:hypothetical protein
VEGSVFFWAITQRVLVILYRRFGTHIGAIPKGQPVLSSRVKDVVTLENGNDRLSRNIDKELLLLAA